MARGVVGASEADRLRFLAAAEHARAVGTVNAPGLFARIVRRGLWSYSTQADEDAAARRLREHLRGQRGTIPDSPARRPPPCHPDLEVPGVTSSSLGDVMSRLAARCGVEG